MCPLQAPIPERGLLSSCDPDLASDSVNMATLPLLVTGDVTALRWQEEGKEVVKEEEEREEVKEEVKEEEEGTQGGVGQGEEEEEDKMEEEQDLLKPRSPGRGLDMARDCELRGSGGSMPDCSLTEGGFIGDKHITHAHQGELLLGLKTLNCSTEILESMEKFLS